MNMLCLEICFCSLSPCSNFPGIIFVILVQLVAPLHLILLLHIFFNYLRAVVWPFQFKGTPTRSNVCPQHAVRFVWHWKPAKG